MNKLSTFLGMMVIYEESGIKSGFLKTNTHIDNYVQEIYCAASLGNNTCEKMRKEKQD